MASIFHARTIFIAKHPHAFLTACQWRLSQFFTNGTTSRQITLSYCHQNLSRRVLPDYWSCFTKCDRGYFATFYQPMMTIPLTILDSAIWMIKRTFQPSIIRKKRKTGFLVRQRTVGGRRTLKRRIAKGRWRLGGGI